MKLRSSLLLLVVASIFTQAQTQTPRPAAELRAASGVAPRVMFASGAKANLASVRAAALTSSANLPLWSGSFQHGGWTYKYTMVGGNPAAGGTTKIPTAILPLNFAFEGWKTSSGHLVTLNGSSIVTRVAQSPLFVASEFPDGKAQFGDAVQRASFWSTSAADWHTVLQTPRVLSPVTVTVPKSEATLFQSSTGTLFAAVSSDMVDVALTKAVQTRTIQPNEVVLVLVRNVLVYTSTIDNCCILGFHTAYAAGTGTQTLIYASWIDPSIGRDVFDDSSLADIVPLSHETSEWMADPLITNKVPSWRDPGTAVGAPCSNALEPGDPIELLNPLGYRVTTNGVKYHVQNVALLSWFERAKSSNAFSAAYSFPDTGMLSSASPPCK